MNIAFKLNEIIIFSLKITNEICLTNSLGLIAKPDNNGITPGFSSNETMGRKHNLNHGVYILLLLLLLLLLLQLLLLITIIIIIIIIINTSESANVETQWSQRCNQRYEHHE